MFLTVPNGLSHSWIGLVVLGNCPRVRASRSHASFSLGLIPLFSEVATLAVFSIRDVHVQSPMWAIAPCHSESARKSAGSAASLRGENKHGAPRACFSPHRQRAE